jgi:hypothetical protein
MGRSVQGRPDVETTSVPFDDALLGLSLAAAAAEIHGVVTDSSGKPVRGAVVRATLGGKTVTRFPPPNGRYTIELPPGSDDLTVEAYGFNPKRHANMDAGQPDQANIMLTPGAGVRHRHRVRRETGGMQCSE